MATHSSADQLYARLIQTSATPNAVPIDGITDCIAVLPAAVTSMTMNSTAIRSLGNEARGASAVGGLSGHSERGEDGLLSAMQKSG